MDEHRVRGLIDDGATLRELADACGVDISTMRRWLRQRGFETERMATLRQFQAARASGAKHIERACPTHGKTTFQRDARGSYRCLKCRADRVKARRRRIKEILAEEAGGKCVTCGYDRCLRALEFHHLDPLQKGFGVAYRGMTRSLARARAEAAKCVLLCSNCHMEVEAGMRSLP